MAYTSVVTAFPRPYGATDPATQLLYQHVQERLTGGSVITMPLSNAPIPGTLLLFMNGVLLDGGAATGYVLNDRTVTLGAVPVITDVFLADYHFRGVRTP